MKLLAGSKSLYALLAVVAVGMGVQTFYLVRVSRQLGASELRTAEEATSTDAKVEDEMLMVEGHPEEARLTNTHADTA